MGYQSDIRIFNSRFILYHEEDNRKTGITALAVIAAHEGACRNGYRGASGYLHDADVDANLGGFNVTGGMDDNAAGLGVMLELAASEIYRAVRFGFHLFSGEGKLGAENLLRRAGDAEEKDAVINMA
ncbi:hypothetical protein KCP73_17940 [Salmonella enterica subsp. enterica]|nr:hypothetical protein KCP73_17940 [Salmonella enterica subsp. enterica]